MNTSDDRVMLLLNERAAEDDELLEAIDQTGVEVRQLLEPGDAHEFASEWAGTVVACGGDGTLNSVVDAVMASGKGASVGVIPFGTANDFASAAGIAELSRSEQLRLVLDNDATPIDVGLLNGRHFVNVASIGFGAEVTVETPPMLKALLGGVAYSITAAVMAIAHEHRLGVVRGEGFEWDGELLLLTVANARMAGGGYRVAPNSSVVDGVFDVTLFPEVDPAEFPEVVAALAHALMYGDGAEWPGVCFVRTPWLKVGSDHPIAYNLDGEPDSNDELDFRLKPRSLPFFLPAGSGLLVAGEHGPAEGRSEDPEG